MGISYGTVSSLWLTLLSSFIQRILGPAFTVKTVSEAEILFLLSLIIIFIFPNKAFMMELTAHQSSVGNVLQAGNQLIAQGNLTEEEEEEIREQMSLLNSRWESLRVASMDRQAR